MEEKICVSAVIVGRVQSVFFRMETQKAANRYGVFGWVRNKRDGTVEALFEGDKKKVDAILKWCEQGPPLSNVEEVKICKKEYSGDFNKFEITY